MIIYYLGAWVRELNICAHSIGTGSNDEWVSWPHTMGHGTTQVLPLSHGCGRCCFCCCCHSHQSGLRSQVYHLGASWHPGLFRHVGVCLAAQPVAQRLGCMPLGLSPLCTLQPGVFTAHSHASLSHQTSLLEYRLKDKITKNSRWQPQNIKSGLGAHPGKGLCVNGVSCP